LKIKSVTVSENLISGMEEYLVEYIGLKMRKK